MPFITSHSHAVSKGIEDIIDPALLADIDALAVLYQNAMMGMSAAAQEARRMLELQGRTGSLDLRLFQEVFAGRVVAFLRESLNEVSSATAGQVIADAERAVQTLPRRISINMSFDRTDPRAIQWAETRAGAMIEQIQAEALASVRGVISNVLRNGGGVARATTGIERIIGLHDRWQTAVNNFYNREVQRLSRTRGAENAVLEAQQSALAYRDQLIRSRAEMIARTEILAAQNIGLMLSWYQAADQGFLDLATADKEWVVGPDGWKGIAVCESCQELAGQRVPVTSLFSTGEISPPLHPNCRCTMKLIPFTDMKTTADEATIDDAMVQ